MPLVDLPLAELLNYQGRNPRPEDFDAYWDAALAEMRAIDPKVELVPHPINADFAECFELRFTGVGGARIFAKYLRPKGKKGCRALLQFHGYTWHSGEWAEKLNWVANGFCVAAMDCRGQGGLSEDMGGTKGTTHKGHIIRGLDDSPEKLLYRSIYLDTAQLASIILNFPEVDADRVGASGGSQGGALTIACAALEPRIKRIAPVYPFLSDYLRTWETDQCHSAYEEIRTFFRFFDPLHERKQEIFERLGYVDIQFLAPRIQAEVLMATGLMDTICLPSTQFAAYNKISSQKELVVYPDFGHEGLPGFNDRAFDFLSDL
jgi:cephalosporin-C deacetylase